ncbi:hypothetical protein [Devosia aurantiaca]|uniref:Uncharacterized protein n=1 Tax=Devosia aurantiaca TaxID=2714858 RepID=A0A6M1SS18_9HYPH|nr:hypothetical protein [Devosia aurantiaca]NGP18182.1 hypothetical protein [Devosia aurantiaca]
MRTSLLLTAACLVAFSSPVLAQATFTEDQLNEAIDVIAADEVSEQAYLDGWCAVALQIVTDEMEAAGETENLEVIAEAREALYNAAGQSLIDAGYDAEQQKAVGKSLYIIAYSQISDELDEPSFTTDECIEAGNAALE